MIPGQSINGCRFVHISYIYTWRFYVDCPWVVPHTPATTAGMEYFKNSLIYIPKREKKNLLLVEFLSTVRPVDVPWPGLGRRWCSTIATLVLDPEAFPTFCWRSGGYVLFCLLAQTGRRIYGQRKEVQESAVCGRYCCKRFRCE